MRSAKSNDICSCQSLGMRVMWSRRGSLRFPTPLLILQMWDSVINVSTLQVKVDQSIRDVDKCSHFWMLRLCDDDTFTPITGKAATLPSLQAEVKKDLQSRLSCYWAKHHYWWTVPTLLDLEPVGCSCHWKWSLIQCFCFPPSYVDKRMCIAETFLSLIRQHQMSWAQLLILQAHN